MFIKKFRFCWRFISKSSWSS